LSGKLKVQTDEIVGNNKESFSVSYNCGHGILVTLLLHNAFDISVTELGSHWTTELRFLKVTVEIALFFLKLSKF